ncbi:MAG: bifunctional DNA primase/polymerase [Candidatus Methylomirabilales bacterium]
MLEHALHLSRLGLSVFPIHAPGMALPPGTDERNVGKVPLVPWAEFQRRRATEEEVRIWWTCWPSANIGVVTGAISGVIVLDVDGEEGQTSLRPMAPVPVTWRSSTGKGQHHWYRHPGGVVRNFTQRAPGLDLRGDGGYVVAPPSLHRSGAQYAWTIAPEDSELVPPPAWLEELLARPEQASGRASEATDWLALLQGVEKGQRHDVAVRIAGHFLAIGRSPEETEAMLLGFAAQCDPPHDPEDVRRIVRDLARKEVLKTHMTDTTTARPTQAEVLVSLAADAEMFHAPDGETAYSVICVNSHREAWPIRSKGYRRWLTRRYYESQRKPPGAQAVADALGVLEARAQFDAPERQVFIRVGQAGDTIYLDLANDGWEAVEITSAGWRVVADPPAVFRRTRGMAPLPHPVPGGSLDDLRRFVNVTGDADWKLLVGWLLGALRPIGPYPVLVLHGEGGSAKSTLARLARMLLDPNTVPLRGEPLNGRDMMIAASNGWCLAFDNLSHLPPWLSDGLCRLSSGGGFGTRELYSDGDEVLFNAQRPVILTGIEELVTRGDLLDRALILYLPQIPNEARRREAEFWRDFDAVRPRILGALLDAVSTALAKLPTVRFPALPRMADFASWVTAAEPALGWPAGTFLKTYAGNREAANDLELEASPVAGLLRELAEEQDYEGTASELLRMLAERVDEATKRQKSWPASPRALSNALRRLAPSLRGVGVEAAFHRETGGGRRRLISVRKIPNRSVPTVPTVPAGPADRDGKSCPGDSPTTQLAFRDLRDDRDARQADRSNGWVEGYL